MHHFDKTFKEKNLSVSKIKYICLSNVFCYITFFIISLYNFTLNFCFQNIMLS